MMNSQTLGMLAAALCLTSCASRSPKPGQALIEVYTDNIHPNRVGDVHFVRHNGKKISPESTHLHLRPGPHEIDLRYQLLGHLPMTTTLPFDAKAGRHYTVSFELTPPRPTNQKLTIDDFSASKSAGQGAMFVFPFELAAKTTARGMRNLGGGSLEVKTAYIDITSPKLSEGIVWRKKVP